MKKRGFGPASHLDQDMRRQILLAAKDLFLAKGYKGVSMKEIAEAVQVTSAALYYHFPEGKEELFTSMIQTVFVDEGVADIDQILATLPGFRERLIALTVVLQSLPLNERFALLLRDAREYITAPDHQQAILSLLDQIRQQVLHLFQSARGAGEIRADIPVPQLVGYYMGLLRESQGRSGAPAAQQLVTVLLDGIASPSPFEHP
jgi:AcrR family transcriptional regulator